MRELQFLTWNLKYGGRGKTGPKAELLTRLPWDIAALQEVTPSSWEVLSESGLTEGAIWTFDTNNPPDGHRPMGSAILARHGHVLEGQVSIAGPKPGRGIAAHTRIEDVAVAVCSWHAPNAAGQGAEAKMDGYRAFLGWITGETLPIVAGFDANHWARSTTLDLVDVPDDPKDRWLLEHQFFGANPPHGLRDVYLDYLRANPDVYAPIAARGPDEPLAVSYQRGTKAKPVDDRFDYVFVSADFECVHAEYHTAAGFGAGSDHAPVTTTVRLKT